MAMSAFRSASKRDSRAGADTVGHRKTGSYSDASSRYYLSDTPSLIDSSNYQDASSQRDSDQDSYEAGAFNRHITSDSESEASSIIDRFRQTSSSRSMNSAASIPRFQQSTASARGRQRSIEPHHRRSESREPVRGESREPVRRSQSREPLRQGSSDQLRGRQGRSESQEPGLGRQGRSESKEPVLRHRRSESRDPGLINRASFSDADALQEPEPQRGRSMQRAEIVFTAGRQCEEVVGGVRQKRSESQEPRGRSYSKEPVYGRHRRSESQGPGPQRHGQISSFRLPLEHPDIQDEERTIRAVHSQLKPTNPPAGDSEAENLYGAMRAEVRKAVADLKTEIEQSLEKDMLTLVKAKGDSTEPDIRRQYAEKLEESESRTQELLSQLAKEEETRLQLSKLVRSLPSGNNPEQKLKTKSVVEQRKSICKALDEEAQKYFEEFASISASETEEQSVDKNSNKTDKNVVGSSRNAVRRKSPSKTQVAAGNEGKAQVVVARNEGVPKWKIGCAAVNTDGVVTPWLDWETESADDTISTDINWDTLVASSSSLPEGDERICGAEELPMQRLRFKERIEAGRIHLCKGEYLFRC